MEWAPWWALLLAAPLGVAYYVVTNRRFLVTMVRGASLERKGHAVDDEPDSQGAAACGSPIVKATPCSSALAEDATP